MRASEWAVSLAVVAVLALQTLPTLGLTPGPIGSPPWMYPFVDYPMYSAVHRQGDAVPRYRVEGITEESATVRVTPESLGLDFWLHLRGPVRALRWENAEHLREWCRVYRRRHGTRLVGFRLLSDPLYVERHGLRDGSAEVVRTVWLDGC